MEAPTQRLVYSAIPRSDFLPIGWSTTVARPCFQSQSNVWALRICFESARPRHRWGKHLIATVEAYNKLAMEHGVDLAGTNPTPDNMAGGLTSIEEKSLGALAKTGTRTIMGVIGYGESPPGSGVWMMDAPAAAVENITALAAGGAQVICFVTGSCNPSGHPIAPTIKISANPATVDRMPTHLDVCLADMVRSQMNMVEAGQKIAETAKLRDQWRTDGG